MQFLILVITIAWSFGISASPLESQKVLVSTPEEAAIYIYNDRPMSFDVEPDKKSYVLYKINLKKRTIEEVPIPKIAFQSD